MRAIDLIFDLLDQFATSVGARIDKMIMGDKYIPNSALEDAYEIHGDGQARMIPSKIVQRPQFQKNIEAIRSLDIESKL